MFSFINLIKTVQAISHSMPIGNTCRFLQTIESQLLTKILYIQRLVETP